MGNACRKNVKDQVKQPPVAEPSPPKAPTPRAPEPEEDEDELRRLRELNERLRKQKEDLEAELARWREAQKQKMEQMKEEIQEVQHQTEKLLGGPTQDEIDDMKAKAAYELKAEMTAAEKEELALLQQRAEFLENELRRMEEERVRLSAVKTDALREAENLEQLLKRLGEKTATTESSEETTESQARERTLQRVADYYRQFKKPENCQELISQSRIDCAELSSQTIRNIRALMHSMKDGDDSWYRERPIRGALCSMMQCGEDPHDRWNCNLCSLLDVTDAPLLL
eukprot:Gregarina_sp_Poly_1__6856@NODE_3712_length_915_cov_6_331368_g2377_i0_p1_GENE_NODE_3712_length_915_cov_6_331368_g2377_i0NODE_3712_length_915_cov_6_331368_g2377_i0_p1_ORF_typecomplete_len284_score54_56HOOK/PF05622_12/0_0006DUF885/PF05960_11/0_0011DUF4164/PF13747_6/0_012DUF4164/PF13747_6/7_8e03RPN6_N/PF18055_1/1_1e03RPN6_N/PF18055_1/5_6e02RPN6_N/PF18055_1/0_014AAA_13/PF13166_6/0_038CCDC158/PF15921_5/0_054DUF1016_N/PF17761_1/1_8e03DUF1016_N/PF17761_1/0_11AIP3/PF03915_13/0_15NBD94/PF16830_5/0_59NBD94